MFVGFLILLWCCCFPAHFQCNRKNAVEGAPTTMPWAVPKSRERGERVHLLIARNCTNIMEKHFQRLIHFEGRRHCGVTEWEVVKLWGTICGSIKISFGSWFMKARNIRWIITIQFHLLMKDFLFCSNFTLLPYTCTGVGHSVDRKNEIKATMNKAWSSTSARHIQFRYIWLMKTASLESVKSFSSTRCRLNLPPTLNHFNFPGKFSPANSLARRARKAPKDKKRTDEVRRYLMVSNGFQWLEQHFI